ncbi:MAG: hypothetical protein KDA31_08815 [Phycisphaerales bacterium]|nr:hypothetical protein [Phycisphaerales bacterium]MCB9836901.1 hypothetical protein [Phycisphaera sp.]
MIPERCEADPTIERVAVDEMVFPLGVYPIEPMEPKQGYTLEFESADGDDDSGDWEEWPDRYVYDIVISAERLPSLVQSLLSIMSQRLYPILDVLGRDAFREIDPYISYEHLALDQFLDGLIRFKDFFFEDGLIGFGAMSDHPFLYIFVDEHKIVTVRAEPTIKQRVESVLRAFELKEREDPAGADSVGHEHRTVLRTADDRPDLLNVDEIVERLRDDWRLLLNVDPEQNMDDRGRSLGITGWRCVVRTPGNSGMNRYSEVLVTAGSLREAEDLAADAVLPEMDIEQFEEPVVVSADRIGPKEFAKEVGRVLGKTRSVNQTELGVSKIWTRRWLTGESD